MKPIKNYPNYAITKEGKVWSKKRKIFLKPGQNKSGYLHVSLSRNNRTKTHPVHKLVLETFIGPRPAKMNCLHKDGNQQNNQVGNLRWGTTRELIMVAVQCGTHHKFNNVGSLHGQSKLVEDDVRDIRQLYKRNYLQRQLAKMYDVSRGNISLIVNLKRWKHVKS